MVSNWNIQKHTVLVTYSTGRYWRVPLSIFFWMVQFVSIFFHKGPPLHFLMFCDRMNVEKFKKVPTFSLFGIMRLFYQNKIPRNGPPSFFWCFGLVDAQESEWVPPLSAPGVRVSGHMARQFGRLEFSKVFRNSFSELYDSFMSFCHVWALDIIVPTHSVPGLFSSRLECDEIFVQLVQVNEYLGNESEL